MWLESEIALSWFTHKGNINLVIRHIHMLLLIIAGNGWWRPAPGELAAWWAKGLNSFTDVSWCHRNNNNNNQLAGCVCVRLKTNNNNHTKHLLSNEFVIYSYLLYYITRIHNPHYSVIYMMSCRSRKKNTQPHITTHEHKTKTNTSYTTIVNKGM